MERVGLPCLPVDGRREAAGTAGVHSLRIVGYGNALEEQEHIKALFNVIWMCTLDLVPLTYNNET